MRRKLIVLGLALVMACSGCIAFVKRGYRDGKVQRANEIIRKGDKRSDVTAKLGEPDETTPVDASGGYTLTFKSCDGMYMIVFGQFFYWSAHIRMAAGDVVDTVTTEKTGEDLLILDNFGVGTIEPSATK